MILLGLTGSIGMGKSTTAAMFADAGIPVWDADAAVHRLYQTGGKAVPEIAAVFSQAISGGAVDRTALKSILTKDPTALKRLEDIVHPLVAEDRRAFINNQYCPLVVLDIPLLFETGYADKVDKIAVVSAPSAVQRERVLARGTMTEDQFEMILKKQMPDSEKRKRADYVIESLTLAETKAQVVAIISELTQHA